MCGVLGIQGTTSLEQGKILLQMLTHRGQDASGIAWINGSTTKPKFAKIAGYADLLKVPQENCNILIGSTRYPTFGTRTDSENLNHYAQPFSYKTKYGHLTIVHNGNITNISVLTQKRYESDAEFLVEILGKKIEEAEGELVRAVDMLMKEVDGSYSIVGIFKDILFAFRDPRGLRPLVIGTKNKMTVIASESIVLQNMGIMEFQDVEPGELIIVDGINLKKKKIRNNDHAHCMFEYVYFANPCSIMENSLVYSVRVRLGEILGKRIEEKNWEIDYIVPVPDTSRPATQGLAEQLQKPVREAIIKNRYLQRTFIMKSKKERVNAAKRKYLYIPEYIKGKNLLVVDDSIVRGLTSKKIIQDLRALGARKIFLAITCPPIRFPCYYGIDFPSDTELIATGHTLKEIKEILDVDDIVYQKLDGLREAIGLNDLCIACLSGSYPTPFAAELRLRYMNGELQNHSHYEGGQNT
ncbi:MAG: amidophosphoribosyltransferase [Candidatus Heimdallarchaeaceae archaeon]